MECVGRQIPQQLTLGPGRRGIARGTEDMEYAAKKEPLAAEGDRTKTDTGR